MARLLKYQLQVIMMWKSGWQLHVLSIVPFYYYFLFYVFMPVFLLSTASAAWFLFACDFMKVEYMQVNDKQIYFWDE